MPLHLESNRGFSLNELTVSLLIAGIVLVGVFAGVSIYFKTSSRSEDFWTRVPLAQEFLRLPIDCDASRYGCSGNINLYGHDTSVLVASDGSSKLRGYPIIAKCESGKVIVQYLKDPDKPNQWTNLLPVSLPVCVGVP